VRARVSYDEFGLLRENATELGLSGDDLPPVRRVRVPVDADRALSALVWGDAERPDAEPELVLLHGGAQNAHTWDSVLLALGRPAVAIDLPGHGHSDAATPGGMVVPDAIAADVAVVVRALAPGAAVVVGMSLGGLGAIALAANGPELVRSLVLVDATPAANRERTKGIISFITGPATFASFDEMLERTIEHNPRRSVSALRRGVLHNALQREDGTWVWRYRRFDDSSPFDVGVRFDGLWDKLGSVTVPVMLVRGMQPDSAVADDDEVEVARRVPHARIERVPSAGHNVQGEAPLELAALLEDFVSRPGSTTRED
jgi:pimeloyl-ACP methyl ester carboxylesterase